MPPQLYGGGWWSDVSEKTTLTQHWLSDPKDGWVLGPCRLRAQHTEGPPERTGLETGRLASRQEQGLIWRTAARPCAECTQRYGEIHEAARRAGIPARAGGPLLRQVGAGVG